MFDYADLTSDPGTNLLWSYLGLVFQLLFFLKCTMSLLIPKDLPGI